MSLTRRLAAGLGAGVLTLTLAAQATPAQAIEEPVVSYPQMSGQVCPAPSGWTWTPLKGDVNNVSYDFKGSRDSEVQCHAWTDQRDPQTVRAKDYEFAHTSRYQVITDTTASNVWTYKVRNTDTGFITHLRLGWTKQANGSYRYELVNWTIAPADRADVEPMAQKSLDKMVQTLGKPLPAPTEALITMKRPDGVLCPVPKGWVVGVNDAKWIYTAEPGDGVKVMTCASGLDKTDLSVDELFANSMAGSGTILSKKITKAGGEFGDANVLSFSFDAHYMAIYDILVLTPIPKDADGKTMRRAFLRIVIPKANVEGWGSRNVDRIQKTFLDQFRTSKADQDKPTRGVSATTGADDELPLAPVAIAGALTVAGAAALRRRA